MKKLEKYALQKSGPMYLENFYPLSTKFFFFHQIRYNKRQLKRNFSTRQFVTFPPVMVTVRDEKDGVFIPSKWTFSTSSESRIL